MTETATLLAALQHGDSFFPSGANAFSWGLETLVSEGRVRSAEDVEDFVGGLLRRRWATFDRAAILASARAGGRIERVAELDWMIEAQTLAAELRDGSRRTGASLLAIHGRLGTRGAARYQELVAKGRAPGHAAAVQGLLWRALGLDEATMQSLSAHLLCVGILAAALRLGVIGHVRAQQVLQGVRPEVARLLSVDAPDPAAMHSFAPEAEIAALRHEVAETRLFAN